MPKKVYLTHNGKTQRIFEWAKELGIPQGRLGQRLRRGESFEEVIATPNRKPGQNRRPINARGNRTYRSYRSMKNRCTNERYPQYHHHGGRGIRVCDRWLESYHNFLEDMGERPDGTSIDRIDNDGDYTPENCRWATPKEQANNRRHTPNHKYLVTYRGMTKPINEMAETLGIPRTTFRRHLKQGKFEGAVTEKLESTNKRP